ncbi:MAG TPA: hypothetical protein PLK67_08465 [Bryobacteraceae bacterium]|nr:hypothetical protein [Bryobacteraceae bacterium]
MPAERPRPRPRNFAEKKGLKICWRRTCGLAADGAKDFDGTIVRPQTEQRKRFLPRGEGVGVTLPIVCSGGEQLLAIVLVNSPVLRRERVLEFVKGRFECLPVAFLCCLYHLFQRHVLRRRLEFDYLWRPIASRFLV